MLKSAAAQYDRSGLSSHTVYGALKQRIASGELEGGTALKQSEIAKKFGVSKITVREALRQMSWAYHMYQLDRLAVENGRRLSGWPDRTVIAD